MKIRIKGNSIRLRLSQSEVQDFDQQGFVKDSIRFGLSSLTYEMRRANTAAVAASFSDQHILVSVPASIASEWCGSNKIGFSSNQVFDAQTQLAILVEKDFKCMTDRPGEDESDLYPNPGNHSKDC